MYRTLTAALLISSAVLDASAHEFQFRDPAAYLKRESRRIVSEGDRIKGQAGLMRSEAKRLNREAGLLRTAANRLDELWADANRAAPDKFIDYSGRRRSQIRMRSDADREDLDAGSLRDEGTRLDNEAVRLWELATAVDPRAQKDLLDRMRQCCQKSSIEIMRAEIIRISRAFGTRYTPSLR